MNNLLTVVTILTCVTCGHVTTAGRRRRRYLERREVVVATQQEQEQQRQQLQRLEATAVALHGEGRLSEAASLLQRAIPVSPPAHRARLLRLLGITTQLLSRLDESVQAFEAALQAQPGWAMLHYNYGLCDPSCMPSKVMSAGSGRPQHHHHSRPQRFPCRLPAPSHL